MTTQQLIDELKQLPAVAQIIMAKDSEGNEFSPLADISTEKYLADTTYSGVILGEDEDEELLAQAITTICFWPLN